MTQIELQVADRFPPGSKVEVFPRVHDFFTPGQTPAVKSATVGKDGSIKLSGLVDHGPYFLAAEVKVQRPSPRGQVEVEEWRSVAFTASPPDNATALSLPDAVEHARLESAARAEVLSKTSIDLASAPGGAPAVSTSPVVEGPRGTGNVSTIGAMPVVARTIPFPRIEDQKKGTPLRSHTDTGEAHPVPEGERQPKPAQSDIPKGTKQRSDTPVGEATPVDPGEVQPTVPQEDVPKSLPQASDTETGEAAPAGAEEPRSTVEKSKPTRSKAKQAKRQKVEKASSTGKAQGRSQAARTTKKRASK